MQKLFVLFIILGAVTQILTVPQNYNNPNNEQNIKINPKDKARQDAKILKQINKINDDGSYTYGYEADDGSFKVETRSKDGVVKGKYGFIDPSGQLKTVEYSAGLKSSPKTNVEDQTVAYATDSKSVEPNDEKSSDSSGEINSNESSSEDGDDQEYNNFSSQLGQKDEKIKDSELTKRQGTISSHDGSNGLRNSQQNYIPTTQLSGGQFRGQFVDPRQFQGGFQAYAPNGQQQHNNPQIYQQGPYNGQQFQGRFPQQQFGAEPQFVNGPQNYQGAPQRQFIGGAQQQYPQNFRGPINNNFSPQYQNGQSDDNDGFISGPPPAGYFNGQTTQSPNFGRGNNLNGQAIRSFGGPGINNGGFRPSAQHIESGRQFGGEPQYAGNQEIDGFSEDNDEDGFVDNYQGNDDGSSSGKVAESADKTPSVKTTTGEKVGPQYSPQALVPQQGGIIGTPQIRGQNFGGSPYDEQELQQIYQQPIINNGRPPQYLGINNGAQQQFPINGYQPQHQHPQFQQSPQFFQGQPQQLPYNPQQIQNYPQFGQAQQYSPYSFSPAQGQFLGHPAQGQFPATQNAVQFSSNQRPGQFLANQGQEGPFLANQGQGGSYLANQGQAGPFLANQNQGTPYDFVGGVGPAGFPLGGPQQSYNNNGQNGGHVQQQSQGQKNEGSEGESKKLEN